MTANQLTISPSKPNILHDPWSSKVLGPNKLKPSQ